MTHSRRRRFLRLSAHSTDEIQAQVDEELRFDLEMRASELVEQGMDADEARRLAAAEFGDFEATRRYCAELDRARQRSGRFARWLTELGQDARLALRGMRRSPGLTIVLLTTLALGIGANTAVFSVVRKGLLERLPYAEPERLVRLYGGSVGNPGARGMLSAAEVADMQESSVFAAVAPFGFYGGYTWTGDDAAEMWGGVRVGPEFFRLLGVSPALGRTIDARDVGPDAVPVVVLSHGLWQRTFAADPGIVGQTVRLNGRSHMVIGVMPVTFVPPERTPEIWTPLDLDALLRDPVARHGRMLRAVGRLEDGVTSARLRVTLGALAAGVRQRYPEQRDVAPANAVMLRDDMVGDVRTILLVLVAAAALVLVLACVNVAGLLLSRATTRQRELAVRGALGAGRGRLIRQLLTESAAIGIAGGVLGVALAFWGKRILVDAAALVQPSLGEARIDGGVLVFALIISIASAVAFGVLPALAGAGADIRGALAGSGRGASQGPGRARIARALVAAQVALAAVLCIGAGLLGRTLLALDRTGVGFDTSADVLTFRVNLSSEEYADDARRFAFLETLTGRIRELPGVRAAGAIDVSPWNGYTAGGPDSLIVRDGAISPGAADRANRVIISDGYLQAVGIPLHRGRPFNSLDRAGAPLVAIVNEDLAQRQWAGEDPIGKRLRIGGSDAPLLEVVGTVGDVRPTPAGEVVPTVYVPMAQNPPGGAEWIVRGRDHAVSLVPALRRVLHDIDPALPLVGARTTADVFAQMLAGQRLPMLFVAVFALLALVLAALGVYGMMAYAVGSRRRELGIRAALGAHRGRVLGLVLKQGMAVGIVGTAAGLIIAAAATRLLAGLLFGMTAHDPVTFTAVPLLLLAITAASCWIPARRATQVEPVEALRAE